MTKKQPSTLRTNIDRNKKPKDFTPSVGCSSNDTMMNNKNNEGKYTQVVLYPDDLSKCFFAIEKEFQNFEIRFLINQLNRRSSLELDDTKIRTIGLDFLIWFTQNIVNDLAPMGQALSMTINSKLVGHRDKLKGIEIPYGQFKEVDAFIQQFVK